MEVESLPGARLAGCVERLEGRIAVGDEDVVLLAVRSMGDNGVVGFEERGDTWYRGFDEEERTWMGGTHGALA